MIEVTGNLWTFPADMRVITTNGFVKKNGECVMGRGCAFEAKEKWPTLPKRIGDDIKKYGNKFNIFPDLNLAVFPTKHNWWEPSDPDLIRKSAELMKVAADEALRTDPDFKIVMPRPGCGNGQLKWEDVKPLLEFLPDNVYVITH